MKIRDIPAKAREVGRLWEMTNISVGVSDVKERSTYIDNSVYCVCTKRTFRSVR